MAKATKPKQAELPRSQEVSMIRDRFLQAMDNMLSTRLNLAGVKLKSRKEFAEILEMQNASLHLIINDDRMPTVKQLYLLCDKCGVSPNWLIMGKGTMFGEEEFTVRMKDFERRVDILEKDMLLLNKKRK